MTRFRLETVAFFGRTLGEYVRMFALADGSLRGRAILDVASGPGSFVAEATAEGLDATGCDPLYAAGLEAVVRQGRADIDRCREQIRRNPGVLVYGDIEAFYAEKRRALERFTADFPGGLAAGRYVAGSLPKLPFPEGRFDLVLTANFLMVYAPLADGGMHDGDDFGLDFHLRSVTELARVTAHELRIPGAHTWRPPPEPHPYLEPMVERLGVLGFDVDLVPSDYDDGCSLVRPEVNRVLVARRRARDVRPGDSL